MRVSRFSQLQEQARRPAQGGDQSTLACHAKGLGHLAAGKGSTDQQKDNSHRQEDQHKGEARQATPHDSRNELNQAQDQAQDVDQVDGDSRSTRPTRTAYVCLPA